jgi:hypothetical protein
MLEMPQMIQTWKEVCSARVLGSCLLNTDVEHRGDMVVGGRNGPNRSCFVEKGAYFWTCIALMTSVTCHGVHIRGVMKYDQCRTYVGVHIALECDKFRCVHWGRG